MKRVIFIMSQCDHSEKKAENWSCGNKLTTNTSIHPFSPAYSYQSRRAATLITFLILTKAWKMTGENASLQVIACL